MLRIHVYKSHNSLVPKLETNIGYFLQKGVVKISVVY